MSEDFAFEVTSKTELILPTQFEKEQHALRGEIEVMTRHAETLLAIKTSEDRIKAIEAGRLLQQTAANITEFYKPIKQAIDQAKKPIRAAEVADMAKVDEAKEKIGKAVQHYDAAQARLAAALEAETLAKLPPEAGIPTPSMAPAKPEKVKGEIHRATWAAEVTDLKALVSAVAAGTVPIMAVEPNQQWLNDRADADREGFLMPGVEARKTESLHFRR